MMKNHFTLMSLFYFFKFSRGADHIEGPSALVSSTQNISGISADHEGSTYFIDLPPDEELDLSEDEEFTTGNLEFYGENISGISLNLGSIHDLSHESSFLSSSDIEISDITDETTMASEYTPGILETTALSNSDIRDLEEYHNRII